MTFPDEMLTPATPATPVSVRGDTFTWDFRLRERVWDEPSQEWVAGDPIDLTGSEVESQLRATKDDPAPLLTFECTFDPDQADMAVRGVVHLEAAKEVTEDIVMPVDADSMTVPWDVQITYAGGRRQTYILASWEIKKDVTHA